jgi:hypothetical protein
VSGTTWTKFYWSDWESDPALRLCSLAAQGLWMRMLCIASAHDPIGYVAVAGRGLDETALARMTGCSGSEAADLLGELERNGVFSRDRAGRIFSRRMVNDARRAAIARKNGKMGGNPTLGKREGKMQSDNPQDNTPLKTQEPEARYQKEELEASPPVAAKAGEPWLRDQHFAAAWDACTPEMRKRAKSKGAAWREWVRAVKLEEPSRIAAAVRAYVRSDPDVHRTGGPGLQRWLKDRAWESCAPDAAPTPPVSPDPALAAHRLQHFAKTGEWKPTWGPKPHANDHHTPDQGAAA